MDKNITLFTHLFYRDPSKYLLERLRTLDDLPLKISLLPNGKHNDEIIKHAKDRFSNVEYIVLDENKGSDQWGLYNLYHKYIDDIETDWILYTHDKHISKLEWLDEVLDPIIECDVYKELDDINAGIICSDGKWKIQQRSEAEITEAVYKVPASERAAHIKQRHTLCWLRELQLILLQETGLQCMDNVNPLFTAGNIFFIRTKVLSQALRCVLDPNFFEPVYRNDGDLGHALERFYFYVSTSMEYNNKFITVKETES